MSQKSVFLYIPLTCNTPPLSCMSPSMVGLMGYGQSRPDDRVTPGLCNHPSPEMLAVMGQKPLPSPQKAGGLLSISVKRALAEKCLQQPPKKVAFVQDPNSCTRVQHPKGPPSVTFPVRGTLAQAPLTDHDISPPSCPDFSAA